MLATAETAASLGAEALRVTLALLAVCLLAALALGLARRRGRAATGPLRVVARLPLEPRRTLYLVEAAGRFLLVGVGDGPMALIAELDAAQARAVEEGSAAPAGLSQALRRALSR